MTDGWVKIHRSLFHNDLWNSGAFSQGQAWVDLLLLAKFKEGSFLHRGVTITYEKGDVTEGVLYLAGRWKWSRGKTSNFLRFLQKKDMITFSTHNTVSKISIKNYHKFQVENGHVPSEAGKGIQQNSEQQNVQQNDNRTYTNKKERKKRIKEIEISSFSFEEFVEMINKTMNRKFRPEQSDEKSIRQFRFLLAKKFERQDFEKVITEAAKDPFHLKNKYKHLTPEFLTRDYNFVRYLNVQDSVKPNLPKKDFTKQSDFFK